MTHTYSAPGYLDREHFFGFAHLVMLVFALAVLIGPVLVFQLSGEGLVIPRSR